MNSEVRCRKPLTILCSCVFYEQEKTALGSGVQVAGPSLQTTTRPFPPASSASWLVLRGKDKSREAIRKTNYYRKISKNTLSELQMMFKQFFGGYSFALLPIETVQGAFSFRHGPSETATAQISRKRTIHQQFFLRPSWSKEQNRAVRVRIYRCFIFEHERPASPPAVWIKEIWGRIPHMQCTQRAGQVLLFIYNTLMRLLHWSTISSSLTLDRWHQRGR